MIFLYEHLTGGGLAGQELPASLLAEGLAMRRAILDDLLSAGRCDVVTTLDTRLPRESHSPRLRVVEVSTPSETEQAIEALASDCAVTWLLAPELEGTLASLAERVEQLGGRLVSSSSSGVCAASDKLSLPALLACRGVPALPAIPWRPGSAPRLSPPWVVKPRFGAGSVGVRLLRPGEEGTVESRLDATLPARWTAVPEPRLGPWRSEKPLAPWEEAATQRREKSLTADLADDAGSWIATPWIQGFAASVALIVGPGGILPLLPCEQRISSDGAFRYLGGRLPLEPALAARAVDLARSAIECVEGLRGWVGVDLLLAPSRSNSGEQSYDCVVEINPRLTTSYVGLRVATEENLAVLTLDWIEGRHRASPLWRIDGPIVFTAEGLVEGRSRAEGSSGAVVP